MWSITFSDRFLGGVRGYFPTAIHKRQKKYDPPHIKTMINTCLSHISPILLIFGCNKYGIYNPGSSFCLDVVFPDRIDWNKLWGQHCLLTQTKCVLLCIAIGPEISQFVNIASTRVRLYHCNRTIPAITMILVHNLFCPSLKIG